MNKRKVSVACVASLALITGITVASLPKNIQPSAQDEDIQSAQMMVNAYVADDTIDVCVYDINTMTAAMIDDGVLEQHIYNADAGVSGASVAQRDWTIYDDEYGLSKMTDSERQYYHRLEDAAVQYISDNTLDAFYVSSYDLYVTNGINYSELGLSRTDAIDVARYFLYNNPQYYFLKAHFLSSSTAVYIGCYDAFVHGSDRAEATNRVFDVIDQWIVSINDDEITAYDKLLSAHNLLCNELDYVNGDFDQSIYSAAVQKETVCAGYAEALSLMLNASGVSSTTVVSDSHAWNCVQLDDGIYYGVDSTWDDILGGHMLLAVGQSDITKYDKAVEHIAITPWTEWAPVMSDVSYSVSTASLSKPSNLRTYCGGASVRVRWDRVSDADQYEVQVDGSSKIKTTSSSSVRLTNIPTGKDVTIYIRAKAVVNGVTIYSDWSSCVVHLGSSSSTKPAQTQPPVTTTQSPVTTTEPAQTTTSESTVPGHTIYLDAPSMSVSNITTDSAKISWSRVNQASGYEYVFAYDANFDRIIADNFTTARGLNLSKLKSGAVYYVRVRAYYTQGGITSYSDWSTVEVPVQQKETSVSAPKSCTVKRTSSSKIRVSWSKVSDANKYEVRVYKDSSMKDLVASKTTILSFASLKTGSYHNLYVAVRSMNTDTGSYSDWVTVSVK